MYKERNHTAMKTTVFCKNPERGVLHFYVSNEIEEHYLFEHRFSYSLYSFFGDPIDIDEALDFTKARNNHAVLSIMDKLISYIRFIEQEYEITLLRLTERKLERKRNGNQRVKTRRDIVRDLRVAELSRETFCDAEIESDGDFFDDDSFELYDGYIDESFEEELVALSA